MYGETKKDLVEIIKKLCEMKQVQLIDGKVCVDHVHMYVAIPPKMCVSEFMSYLKGKSTLMLFDRHPEYRTKWGDRHFWARGYFVSTVGNVNEETVRKYIQEQEENDKLEDGSAVRIPQCEEESTYAPKLEKTMGNIDWTMDADRIERLVRGLNSWPGTFTKIHGKTVKIWDCDVVCQETLTESQAAATPGTVIVSEKDQLIVKAGNGALSLRMLQPEGKKNMTVDAYLRGYPIAQGELFTQV